MDEAEKRELRDRFFASIEGLDEGSEAGGVFASGPVEPDVVADYPDYPDEPSTLDPRWDVLGAPRNWYKLEPRVQVYFDRIVMEIVGENGRVRRKPTSWLFALERRGAVRVLSGGRGGLKEDDLDTVAWFWVHLDHDAVAYMSPRVMTLFLLGAKKESG